MDNIEKVLDTLVKTHLKELKTGAGQEGQESFWIWLHERSSTISFPSGEEVMWEMECIAEEIAEEIVEEQEGKQ